MNKDCPNSNPCNCIGTPITPSNPPVQDCPQGCCLNYCSAIIAPQNAVGPCGQTGLFDLRTLAVETGCCENEVAFQILASDKAHFVGTTITGGHQLKWVSQGADRKGKFGIVRIKATCKTDKSQTLNKIFTVTIGMKDLCEGVVCEDCFECDPCSGACIKSDVTLMVNEFTTPADLAVNQ